MNLRTIEGEWEANGQTPHSEGKGDSCECHNRPANVLIITIVGRTSELICPKKWYPFLPGATKSAPGLIFLTHISFEY
jgi:hypothetical protein